MTGGGPSGGTSPTGVLLMSYGTPASPGDVEAFYTDIRRGRRPTPEQLADLRRRYDAIGGTSPLAARTRAQVEGLQAALGSPDEYVVAGGTKHARPSIEAAVRHLADKGVAEMIGLVLAPHYSKLSTGEYIERARSAAAALPRPVQTRFISSWHLAEGLIESLRQRLVEALEALQPSVRRGAVVLVTAHSLPARVVDMGDPYPDQLRETAEELARRAHLDRWQIAWQSAGRTPEPWLGPDVLEVIRDLPERRATAVVVCPAGFVSDHLEVLYDVDVEARAVARSVGLPLVRTRSLNDDPALLETLATLVRRADDEQPR